MDSFAEIKIDCGMLFCNNCIGRGKYCMLYILVALIVVFGGAIAYFMHLPRFGRLPKGDRLARIERSANYRNGKFSNLESTLQFTSHKNKAGVMFDFLFEKRENNRPQQPLDVVKSDLMAIDIDNDILVWFGHSSFLLQSGGRRILVDPVFGAASPISFINKPFLGTNIYDASDIPAIDYLVITHDHWDHLDYETVLALKNRVERVVCPLGVGEHLESWGYSEQQIVELDWDEKSHLATDVNVFCLPARHFSGRSFTSNQTLWASFMFEIGSKTIYISGDGGYGAHFARIAKQFPKIDLAIIENGQYNDNWRFIHLMPNDLKKVIQDLKPQKIFTSHHGKYALSKHTWYEPLNNAAALAQDSLPIVMPRIGEVVFLGDSVGAINRWWQK